MHGFIYEFFSASILMGLAIGLDAAIATSAQANAISKPGKALVWLAGISFTHTVFPMIGYMMSYYGLQEFPMATPLIGVAAFYLIAHFVYGEYKKMLLADSEHEHESSYMISLGLILAVSWDALWSGPAKSAQVIEWPPLAIWTSFLVVGATVAILSTLAFFTSTRFIRSTRNIAQQHKLALVAQWLQLSAVSYFGWLALVRYTFGHNLTAYELLLFAFSSTAVIMCLLQYRSNLDLYRSRS